VGRCSSPRRCRARWRASLRDLASDRAAVRASAIKDLARHAQADEAARARAIPLLERALKNDEHAQVRGAAAVALADVKGNEGLATLLAAVEDVDGYVRQMALSALGEIGDPRALPRIERALADERPEVRYQAIIAYARFAPADDVVPALVRATSDADPAIRYIALRLAEDRVDAAHDGADAKGSLLARAKELLEDEAGEVRLAAAIHLAKSGDLSGRSLLLGVIAGTARAEPEDEREAVEIAGAVGLKEAVPHLERRAWGLARYVKETCAWSARIALARMGNARATSEILKDLESRRRDARDAAVVAAGRAKLVEARARIGAFAPGEVDADLVREALARLDSP
jgi:HEAT repeat protein